MLESDHGRLSAVERTLITANTKENYYVRITALPASPNAFPRPSADGHEGKLATAFRGSYRHA